MKIVLNEIEQELCQEVAKARTANNRSAGTVNLKVSTMSNEEVELEGIAAEIAFCKYFNVYPDLEIKLTGQDTDVGDALVSTAEGHFTVDIKTTKYKKGRLLVAPNKSGNVDYFALMVGTFPEYEFKGVISSEEAMTPENLTDLGYGKVYAITQDKLKNII